MNAMAATARLLLYLAVMIAVGDVCVQWVRGETWSARAPYPQRRRPLVAWLAGLTALLLMFVVQFLALELAPTVDDVAMLARQTAWGNGWLVLAGCAVAGVLATIMRATLVVRLVVVVALAMSMGGLGHAAADDAWPWVSRLLDATHALGVAAWLGTLVCLDREPHVASWARFSALAEVAAPLAVLSGVGSALRRLNGTTVTQIFGSEYGRLLGIKVAVVALVLLIGAWHRRRLRTRQIPSTSSVRAELMLALMVLGLTAILTGTAPPGE